MARRLVFAALLVALSCFVCAHEPAPDFDLYAALGLSQSASPEAVRKAYKGMARRFHPDRNKEPGAQERFIRAQLAYETLSDDAKRREYDEFRTTGRQRAPAPPWSGNGGRGGGGGGFRTYTFFGHDGRQYTRTVWEGAPPDWSRNAGRGSGFGGIGGLESLLLLGCALLGVAFLLGGRGGGGGDPTPTPPRDSASADAGAVPAPTPGGATPAPADAALRALISALESVASPRQEVPGVVPRPLPAIPLLFSPSSSSLSGSGPHTRQAVIAVLRVVRVAAPPPTDPGSADAAAGLAPPAAGGLTLDDASQKALAALCALAAALRHDPVQLAWVPSPDSLPALASVVGSTHWGLVGLHLTQWAKRVARIGRGAVPAAVFLRWRPGADTARAVSFGGPGGGGDHAGEGEQGLPQTPEAQPEAQHWSASALVPWAELLLQGSGAQLADVTDVMQPLLASSAEA